jgi:anti-sigma B factor antagonist
MFEIWRDEDGTVWLKGRLDASQVAAADVVLDLVLDSCNVDFSKLEYISSAGLGVLLKNQQRLGGLGHEITLTGLSPHIKMVFDYAGFEAVFKML